MRRVRFEVIMADMLKSMMDKITDDNPETRGQKLWVMFALAVLLVAAMNYYAMVREPEIIPMDELVEFNNEVVKVEGKVISWREDPWNSGDWETHVIISDGTAVVEVRWSRPAEIPPIGTNVVITGEVAEFQGNIFMRATGSGAMEWSQDDLPDIIELAIVDVAIEPEKYVDEVITLTGYIGESIPPDEMFVTADLRDHPSYGNSEHQIKLNIRSNVGEWIESSSKIQVTGTVAYNQRELNWVMSVQGPEILVDRNHPVDITRLDWGAESTWSYQSGNLVNIAGYVVINGDDWSLRGPSGTTICLNPSQEDLDSSANSSWDNTFHDIQGRLMWSESDATWCVDANEGTPSGSLDGSETTVSLLALLSGNPVGLIENPTQRYTLSAFIKYPIEPSVEDVNGYFVDSSGYMPGQTTIAATFPAQTSTQWLEAGQQISANVSVTWDDEDMRIRLQVHDYVVGDVPSAKNLLWEDGATQWGYSRNQMVNLDGLAVQDDSGDWWLQREGTNQSIRLSTAGVNSIGTDSLHNGTSMTWTGRMMQIEDVDSISLVFSLISADVIDSDGDGLSDDLESIYGTNPYNPDTDGDGSDDRFEIEEDTNPTSAN
tara:strand:+ start:110 stop:1915 length:1806 start_codon:yes stop_codon:yes gene_type:complete